MVPPMVKGWVRRAGLLERVGVPPRARLSVIHAGAGFGKSAFLVQWHRAMQLAGLKTAWLSLARDDRNELLMFICQVSAAIHRVCPAIGADVLELATLHGKEALPGQLRTLLINSMLAWNEPLMLIIDDYHFIESPAIHEWLVELVARAPANFTLALAARALPPLRLARLRAADAVAEVDASALAFSFGEVRAFLQGCDRHATGFHDAVTVYECTEGWVVGLQMVTSALRARHPLDETVVGFGADAQSVGDYLHAEVLDCLPGQLVDFLLALSMTERFCAALCDAITRRADAAAMLEQVERRGLFIVPLDEQGQWFRFHHLFGAFLRAQSGQRFGSRMELVHARACGWFADQKLWSEAVRHAVASGDATLAMNIAERCAMALVHAADYLALQSLIARLPADCHRQGAQLLLARAWMMAMDGQAREVETVLAEVDAIAPCPHELSGVRAMDMLAIRATLAYVRDDADAIDSLIRPSRAAAVQANSWVNDVLKLVDSVSLTWRGRCAAARDFTPCTAPFRRVFQMLVFGWSFLCEGDGAQAQVQWFSALELADSELGAQSVAAALARVPMARLAYEEGQFDEVELLIGSRLHLIEHVGLTDFLDQAVYALAWARHARGAHADAIDLIERTRLFAVERALARLEVHMSTEIIRMCWREQPSRVAHIARRMEAIMHAPHQGQRRSTHWLGASLAGICVAFELAVRTRSAHDLVALGTAVCKVVRVACGPHVVSAVMLLAIAEHHGGNAARARDALVKGLLLAQPLLMLRTFVDCGPWVLPVLLALRDGAEGRAAAISPDFLQRVIVQFGGASGQRRPTAAAAGGAAALSPLSQRELEILMLITHGLSNKSIGRTLGIGPETVKWHLKNVFDKLGVNSRQMAVIRARALSLLD